LAWSACSPAIAAVAAVGTTAITASASTTATVAATSTTAATVTAPAATVTAATAAGTSTTAATAGAFGLGPCFIHYQVPAAEILTVQGVDGAVGVFVIVDFYEGKTTRLPCETIAN
jgi:hypothetical protein